MKSISWMLFVPMMLACGNNDTSDYVPDAEDVKRNVEAQQELSEMISKPNPVVIEELSVDGRMYKMYKTFGFRFRLTDKRPDTKGKIRFCAAAAYTGKKREIDGFYMINGVKKNTFVNKGLTGYCVITYNHLEIGKTEELNSVLIGEASRNHADLFQQSLLVFNKEVIPCNLFKKRINQRRALVVSGFGNPAIIESVKPMTIMDFSRDLKALGVISAVNLDMGGWSEGWYLSPEGVKTTIGEFKNATGYQSNWIVYEDN